MSADTFPAPAPPGRGRDTPHGLRRSSLALAGMKLSVPIVLGGLLALVVVSAQLRTVQLHFHYWIDEGISVGIASHPVSVIPGLMRQDGSPPLYYLILHAWMAAFGRDEVATHELSLVVALVTIPVGYWAGASLFGRRAGAVCAILTAGLPYLTTYAQETRMYSLMALLSIVVAASFVHTFVRRRRRYLPVFSLSLAMAAYTHNWGLFLGVMCGVAYLWCLWRSQPPRRALWRDGGLAFGVVVVLFAPWLPTVAYQAQHTGAPWDIKPVFWSLSEGLYSMAGGRGAAMVMLLTGGVGLASVFGAVRHAHAPAICAAGVSRRLAAVRRPLADPADDGSWLRLAAECLVIMGVGTMVLAFAYSKVNSAWAVRYLAAVVGPLTLVFGLGIARARSLGVVGLVLLAGFWILDPVPHSLEHKSNVHAVATHIRPALGSDALVLSTAPEQVAVLDYYLPAVRHWGTPLGPVADPRVVDWRDALTRFERSSVSTVLVPMLRSLTAGERVALVTPVTIPHAPLYMRLIRRATHAWSDYLARDRALRRVGSTDADSHVTSEGLQAVVYVRR